MGSPAEEAPDVRETYDRIAAHFDETRRHPWPEVESFVDASSAGDLGLDVGCGNGRHTTVLARSTRLAIGLDLSRELLLRARGRIRSTSVGGDPARIALIQGDARSIPIAADRVDVLVYVATIHHIPDPADRRRSLDEIARVLASGGRGLIGAWCTAHERFDESTGFDTVIDWTLPDGTIVPRFYHIYDPSEFRDDLAASRLAVAETFVSSGNCYAVVRSP